MLLGLAAQSLNSFKCCSSHFCMRTWPRTCHAGFDVWLPNTRSNTFSRGNYRFSHRDMEYWYHSIDEYALIDNPAMINKALEVSGASKLAFVGHSQVCTCP